MGQTLLYHLLPLLFQILSTTSPCGSFCNLSTCQLLVPWYQHHLACVLWNEASNFKFTEGLTWMAWFLIWYQTPRQMCRTNRLTLPVICTQQLPVYYQKDNRLIQRFALKRSKMSSLFKNCSIVEVIYLLIRFNKTWVFTVKHK